VALVLLNRLAGSGRAVALEPRLRAALAALPGHRLVTPASVHDARALLSDQPPATRVALVGGDGTVHHLLSALLSGGHSLGLVAAGSGDDIARALGVHELSPEAALALAVQGNSTPWDVGVVQTAHEQRCFLSSLCVGFDAAIAARARALPPWLAGRHRYTLATLLQLLGLRSGQVSTAVDGVAWHQGQTLLASVLNTRTYGGGMPAVPGARPDDGQLNLLHAGRFGRLEALRMLPALMTGRHLGHPQIQTCTFRELLLQSPTPLALAADGEAMLSAVNMRVRVRAGALQVVARH
jgi:diacylglycerol kinase (ATP)